MDEKDEKDEKAQRNFHCALRSDLLHDVDKRRMRSTFIRSYSTHHAHFFTYYTYTHRELYMCVYIYLPLRGARCVSQSLLLSDIFNADRARANTINYENNKYSYGNENNNTIRCDSWKVLQCPNLLWQK